MGESTCDLIRKIFDGGSVDSDICHTLIVLILKKDNPESFNQFRPISLCNAIYKIITKFIANQFKLIMNKVVTPCNLALFQEDI